MVARVPVPKTTTAFSSSPGQRSLGGYRDPPDEAGDNDKVIEPTIFSPLLFDSTKYTLGSQ